jgi:hypothetical protein
VAATLADLTCDSDGKVDRFINPRVSCRGRAPWVFVCSCLGCMLRWCQMWRGGLLSLGSADAPTTALNLYPAGRPLPDVPSAPPSPKGLPPSLRNALTFF